MLHIYIYIYIYIYDISRLRVNVSHSSGLHIRSSNRFDDVYMRVTRPVDRNLFFLSL